MITLELKHGAATTLDQALEAISQGATPYAGATELIPAMRLGLLRPDKILDLKRVKELAGIRVAGDAVEIGATTTHEAIATAFGPASPLPAVPKAFASIGNPRVRAQGTIGGNVVFAEPRSDVLTFLYPFDVDCRFAALSGERVVSLREALVGPFTLERATDELLVSLQVRTDNVTYQDYARIQVGERPAVAIALAQIDGAWRMSVGAATYTPTLLESADLLELTEPDLFDQLELLEDLAGSADYKRHLVGVLAGRMVEVAGEARAAT